MASRRTRIKGIANIPQRRKNIVNEEKNNENDHLTNRQDEEKEIKQPLPDSVNKLEDPLPCDSSLQVGKVLDDNQLISENQLTVTEPNIITNIVTSSKNVPERIENQVSTPDPDTETRTKPQSIQPIKPPIKRRTFIKPAVSISAINRKPKQNIEKEHLESTIVDKAPPEIDKIETLDNSAQQSSTEHNLKEKQPAAKGLSNIGHEVTLDEVHLTPQNGVSDEAPSLDRGVKKILPHTNNAPNSDTEYPPPPPSPSKINRSRIKAIPRLGYRKTSFSASESEDESKRNYNRNRNDSVCSTASGVPESIGDCFSPQRPKDFNSAMPKKCNRTEQSRKLAEARREFQRRFGTNKPDRQKLTMIDLIFYNPTSNPMINEVKSKSDTEEVEETTTDELKAETKKVDDPQPEIVEEAGKSDEENEMPVPQIKIGPSGEIILDEKSLVIENKEVKKQREDLQKTKLVDGDFDTGYGIYKRQKRAKEWMYSETLRFYKALNTIGTDFTLMCELFPRRTRRELKQKFKKEERINRALIDKAVMHPCNFDYAELKHEVDMEEKELEELQKQKEEGVKLKREKMAERQSRKRKPVETAEVEKLIEEMNPTLQEEPEPLVQPKPPKIRKVRKSRLRKFNIESVLQDSDADVSDMATQSESEDEEEIVPSLKPTRSGRVPKVTRKFDTLEECSIEKILKRNRVASVDTNTSDIEPGSIMIVTDVGSNGEPVHKIYMVTADKNATPVSLNSEILSKAIQFKRGITAQNILTISANVTDDEAENEQVFEENNVTIPADESVTTLRGNVGVCNGDIPEEMVLQDIANVSTRGGPSVKMEAEIHTG